VLRLRRYERISVQNLDRSQFGFVTMHAFDRQTDRRADRRADRQLSLD